MKLNKIFAKKKKRTVLKAVVFIASVLVMANLGAVTDYILHPDISYFDDEHIIVGGLSALFTALLLTAIFIYTENLYKSGELLRSLFDASADFIYLMDKDGLILQTNRAMVSDSGYAEDELIGKRVTDFFEPSYKKVFEDQFLFLLKNSLNRAEVEFVFKNGKVAAMDWSAAAIYNDKAEIVSFMVIQRDMSERKKAEEALRESEVRFRKVSQELDALLSAIPDSIVLLSPELKIIWANPAASKALGRSIPELAGKNCYDLWHNSSTPCEDCPVQKSFKSGNPEEKTFSTPEGRIIDLRTFPIKGEAWRVVSVLEIGRDITEHRSLETQLFQSQKMEAIGRLAGGVAHDFNNMLMAIKGYSDMLLDRLSEKDPLHKYASEIKKAGNRAAALTSQLLAFSRRQMYKPEVLDINIVIKGMKGMLTSLINEDIELIIAPGAELGRVKADPGQIEQILLNLAVNSRDAMPEGGKIVIETSNAFLDETYVRSHQPVKAGSYIMLAVSDTGHGIDEEIREHIFEPFFTTKETGKGTGLGLATVYGIVKQNEGYIWVYSEKEKGTTFKIYLPSVDEEFKKADQASASGKIFRGSETVLIVEDEEVVRKLVCEVLHGRGFTVLEACNGREALKISENYKDIIHLMVTDVVMPEINGKDLAEQLTLKRPEMKVIFMSGYTNNAVLHSGKVDEGTEFLQKPFTPDILAGKVREVLDNVVGE